MEKGSSNVLFGANRWLTLKHFYAKLPQPICLHWGAISLMHIPTPPCALLTSKSTHLTSFGGNGSSAMPSPKDNGCSCWIDPVGKTGTCNTKSATQNCKLGAEVLFSKLVFCS